ncbi:MAG: DUF2868 domain-containing protein [Burkholderiaceae bacterium]|nr:DUF2868 domain-containing protein [Burkholderiaceae bacterium]
MNEAAAREVLLVRAIETSDSDHALLSGDDREYASRTAAELARWSAAERREPADADRFLAHRARLLLDKLGERSRIVRSSAQSLAWRWWIGWALPAVALVAGLLFERLANRGHVNVLAFPLLVLLLWNLAVYLLLALAWLGRVTRTRPSAQARTGPTAWLRRVALQSMPRAGGAFAPALARFAEDWLTLGAPLTTARIARTLHLAAALFAAGAIGGLYVRGLVFDYRAGWESTFLDAQAVHALLSAVVGPAASLLGQAFPTVDEIAALRFGPAAAGESAARWIHWYALTVAAVVVAPRLLLAGWAALRAQRWSHTFPIDLSAPYFRRLVGGFSGRPSRIVALPFSYSLDGHATTGLAAIARQLLGDRGTVDLRSAIAFGDESRAAAALVQGDAQAAPVALNLALFSLAATPEQENHGAFLDGLQPTMAAPRVVLVDEGPYRRRLGTQAGATARVVERREAWRAFAASRGWPIVFADFAAPDLDQVERDLGPVLGSAA